MVTAIALCLSVGNEIKHLGRFTDLSDFIKKEKGPSTLPAEIEVELYSGDPRRPNHVVTRTISVHNQKTVSKYKLNGRPTQPAEMTRFLESLKIQSKNR